MLSARIREAIDCYVRRQRQISHKTELARQMERLSARQREVLDLLIAGERCKQIARELGIGEKTVAKHRATVLEKLQVDNVVELVHLFANTDLSPALRSIAGHLPMTIGVTRARTSPGTAPGDGNRCRARCSGPR